MTEFELNRLSEIIIVCAYKVSNGLGRGFLEKVYENALAHELAKTGLKVRQQDPIQVHYDGIIVGEYVADLLVEEVVLVELNAVKLMDEIMVAQCMKSLRATDQQVCLLLNFGRPCLEIRRIIPNDTWRSRRPQPLTQ